MRYLITAVFLLLGLADAAAQQFPLTLPANTVYGRLGIGSGPGQAIPFRTLASRIGADTVNITSFGALCNGTTDDTAAIQAAGNYAISAGKPLFISPSVNGCIVSQNGSNPWALSWSSPLAIIGIPGRSIIRPSASLASTVNIIYFFGSTNSYQRYIVDGVFIGNPLSGTRTGNHALVFDTLSAGNTFYHPQVKNSFFQQSASGTGWSIFAINSQANNPNGGITFPEFKDNTIGSGVSLIKSGDSAHFIHNVFFGTSANPGIYLDLVNGGGGTAGNTVIDGGNNFQSSAGAIIIDCAYAPIIVNNEVEQPVTSTEANGALIDVTGANCTVDGARILANQMQSVTAAGTPTFIRVATSSNTVIDFNRIATPTNFVPVVITAGSTGAIIGSNNSFSGMTVQVTDGGTATRQGITVPYGSGGTSQFLRRNTANGAVDVTQPTIGMLGGLGTGVATALGVNVGSAGAFVTFNGALGTPSSGTLTNGTGLPIDGGTINTLPVARGGTGDTGTAWASYTVNTSCGAGSGTLVGAGAFKQIGKTTFFRLTVSITAIGTCTGVINADLPAAPKTSIEMTAAARNVTSAVLAGARIRSDLGTLVAITNYAGAAPGTTGDLITVTGVYEAN